MSAYDPKRTFPMRWMLALFAICCASIGLGQTATWSPKVEFTLEDANYTETLTWVSGWSYALTEVGRTQTLLCVPQSSHVDSKILLDFLNTKYRGQKVRADDIAPVLFAAARAKYGCRK